MNGKVIASFLIGVVAGAAGGIFYARRSIDEIVAEEVESVRDSYKQQIKDLEQAIVDISDNNVKESTESSDISLKEAYERIVEEEGYSKEEKESNYIVMDNDKYVESQEEYDGYDVKTLLYTSNAYIVDDKTDKVLATDVYLGLINMNVIDVARKFKELDDDVFYVANKMEKCVFEILLTDKEYKEE